MVTQQFVSLLFYLVVKLVNGSESLLNLFIVIYELLASLLDGFHALVLFELKVVDLLDGGVLPPPYDPFSQSVYVLPCIDSLQRPLGLNVMIHEEGPVVKALFEPCQLKLVDELLALLSVLIELPLLV